MKKFNTLTPNLSLAALLVAAMLPVAAHAGEQTRAEAAIAAAQGKIDAGDKIGVAQQAPELQGQARQALLSAQDLLSHHQKRDAIAAAQHAGELADQALVSANSRKAQADRDRRSDLKDVAVSAQTSAAEANARASSAEAATATADNRADAAQQATMSANNRAAMAEQSSATANAQADALRNPPAPTETTVAVTEHETRTATSAPMHHRVHHVVRRHTTHPVLAKSTTTVVTTSHP